MTGLTVLVTITWIVVLAVLGFLLGVLSGRFDWSVPRQLLIAIVFMGLMGLIWFRIIAPTLRFL